VTGGLAGAYHSGDTRFNILVMLLIGIGTGILFLILVQKWSGSEPWEVIGGTAGGLAGTMLGLLLSTGLIGLLNKWHVAELGQAAIVLFCFMVGFHVGRLKAKELKTSEAPGSLQRGMAGILDTSVIIDGRIADICETGFIAGDLMIPQFVLRELQMIADSGEATRRTRGRRGLDILNKIQKQSYVEIVICDTDYPSIREVDQKLIALAKDKGFPIVTNDYNLNKVAEVHSIQVLNINRLANALKPIVLPGETIRVPILKEGKEPSQGVAYLDDGTMVVVENGRRFIGRTMDVVVTSVLQTTAGRMIFVVVK
jgi:uncharacterized protein YacL